MRRRRSGFTLVEMMVSMALTMFIMMILAQAFVQGLETFSSLKAIGDMQENLRAAATQLRDDLVQDHFEAKRRLSDPFFTNTPIREGFFYLRQGTASTSEGTDQDGLVSYRATDHVMHFTVKKRGNGRDRFFAAPCSTNLVGPNLALLTATTTYTGAGTDASFQEGTSTYNSQWAEVAYFLVRTGTVADPNDTTGTASTPIYALYRSQYVVVPNPTSLIGAIDDSAPNQDFYKHLAWKAVAGKLVFAGPDDLPNPVNRTFDPKVTYTVPPRAASLVLSDVISFQIQVITAQIQVINAPGGSFGDLPYPAGAFGLEYDSSVVPTNPAVVPIGIQITLRVWDNKSGLTRQMTLVVDF